MSDLLRLLTDLFHAIWPFRLVATWEVGLLYACGRYQFSMKPGLKVVVPFFLDVHCVSVVPRSEKTPLNTVTLSDSRTLTYRSSLLLQVEDAAKAYNSVDNWAETVVEIADGLLSELLAEADPKRFETDYGKRERLREEIRKCVDEACQVYGVRVRQLWFTDFGIDLPAVRLMGIERSVVSKPM